MIKVIVCQSSTEHLVLFFFSLSVSGWWISSALCLSATPSSVWGPCWLQTCVRTCSWAFRSPPSTTSSWERRRWWSFSSRSRATRVRRSRARVCLWGCCGEWFLISVCLAQVCFTFWARSWTSVRTPMCTSSTSRRRVRQVRSKKWSASVERAAATMPSASRTSSRYSREKPSSWCIQFGNPVQCICLHVTFIGAMDKHTILTVALSYCYTSNDRIKKTFNIRSHLHLLSFIKLIIIKWTITYILYYTTIKFLQSINLLC